MSISTPGPLGPYASDTFEVYVEIPADALVAESDAVDVTVTSQGDNSKTTSVTLTTWVIGDYGVTMVDDQTIGSGVPGAWLHIRFC